MIWAEQQIPEHGTARMISSHENQEGNLFPILKLRSFSAPIVVETSLDVAPRALWTERLALSHPCKAKGGDVGASYT